MIPSPRTDSFTQPCLDRVFAFDEARKAFSHLESGANLGKIVIRCAS